MVGSTEDVDPAEAPKVAAAIFGAVGVYGVCDFFFFQIVNPFTFELQTTNIYRPCRYFSSSAQVKLG